MDTANNKTLNCTGEDKDKEECNISEQTVKQFQILIVIVFIKKFVEEDRQVEIRNN